MFRFHQVENFTLYTLDSKYKGDALLIEKCVLICLFTKAFPHGTKFHNFMNFVH
jgi:hypothetical protein